MNCFFPTSTGTIRALKEIILTIIDTNIEEMAEVEAFAQLLDEIPNKFNHVRYFPNGSQILFIDNQIFISFSVKAVVKEGIIYYLKELQSRIYHDVKQLTGHDVTSVDIKLKKVK